MPTKIGKFWEFQGGDFARDSSNKAPVSLITFPMDSSFEEFEGRGGRRVS